MSVMCAATTLRLRHTAEVENTASAHLSQCLSCQVYRSRIRRIDRTMAAMAFTTVPAPSGLMAVVGAVGGGVRGTVDIPASSAAGRLPERAAAAVTVAAAGLGAVVGGAAILVWRRAHV